ncbi:MAG: DUF2007 domain-containing protein [Ignavibacteria bacterium]|nr:DUF2007 domain-containing protein [Ignavibacteria bacterium]
MSIVIVKTYEFPYLAHLDRAKLADEGIDSFVRDENVVSVAPFYTHAVGGVKLMVRGTDLQKAKEVLRVNEYSELSRAFDGQVEEQVLCPNCGSVDISQHRSMISGFLFLLLFFLPVALFSGKHVCGTCGHTWKSADGGSKPDRTP